MFTYLVATDKELGMAKDTMAAKPMVLFESDNLVALASEEVAIRAHHAARDRHLRPLRRRGPCMAEIARCELDRAGAPRARDGPAYRAAQRPLDQKFFDIDLDEAPHGFSLPNAYDVDFNKRAEIDASNMPANTVNLRIRELMQDGYGTIVIKQSWRQAFDRRRHSQSAQSHHRRLARLFRLRADRRPECAHLPAASAGPAPRT